MRKTRRYRLLFTIILFVGLGWGALQVLSGISRGTAVPIIAEFLAANQDGLTDQDGDHSDWIEIYNPNPRAIKLSRWALTDDPQEPDKWPLPNVTLNGHEHLLVFSSGKNRKPTQNNTEWHTNLRLDRDGEFLGLYDLRRQQFVDIPSLPEGSRFPTQFQDISFGCRHSRDGDTVEQPTCGYLFVPTPGQPNAQELLWAGLVDPVRFDRERGWYRTPLTLGLSTVTPGATIHYTTDGSEPTETHGTVYSNPIEIASTTTVRAAAFRPGFRASPVDTHTYLFFDQVVSQPVNPPGYQATWGAYEDTPVLADYEMDPEVVSDPRYAGALEPALQSIPTISIVTDVQSWHEIYANPRQKGRVWERPVSVEYWEAAGQEGSFQVNAGIRIQGELGRLEIIPKHAFRLFFRDEYGAARLESPLFPDSAIQSFDTLTLRSGVNRSYAGWPDTDQIPAAYTRDEWLRASQLAMSGTGSHGTFAHLYLNGLYWGLYNIVERPDESFMASYHGGPEEDWLALNHGDPLGEPEGRFETLHQLAGLGQLVEAEAYAVLQEYLDIPHFIDYVILNWHAGNLDWAFNNWYASVRRSSGQVRYFVWDGERTWYDGAEIYMGMDEYDGRPNLIKPLFEALLQNPDFCITLADRLYKHLHHDGALTDGNAQARLIGINDTIEQAIVAESARWGDTREESPITQADWFVARDDVLGQMEGNAAKLIALAREAGYYPLLDPPAFSQHGGQIAPGFELTIDALASQEDTVYYTTDGSDPRQMATGAVSPTAREYVGPLTLTSTTQVKARVRGTIDAASSRYQGWSAMNEALWHTGDERGRLRITEIMYNPVGGDEYEFVELENTGSIDLDLASVSFEGISFTFPPVVEPLSPGEFIVLVRSPVAFAQRYPGVAFAGVYSGRLANGGERIALVSRQGHTLDQVRYDDRNGWPRGPDGRGYSLTRVDADGAPDNPTSWRASTTVHGSPGRN